jgi:methionyl-tRNA formyltransferase
MPRDTTPSFVVVGDGGPAKSAVRFLVEAGARIAGVYTTPSKNRSLISLLDREALCWNESATLRDPDHVMPTTPGTGWLINAFSPVILPAQILDRFPHRALNLHNGPLPSYAGLNVTQWAIRNGEANFACTVHEMTTEIDAGPILAESPFTIGAQESGIDVFRKSMYVGAEALISVLDSILKGHPPRPRPQPSEGRRVYTRREAADSVLEWSGSAEQVRNFIRAADYRPLKSPSYKAQWQLSDGKVIDLAQAEVVDGPLGLSEEVLSVESNGPVVACGAGSVALTIAFHEGTKLTEELWRSLLNR